MLYRWWRLKGWFKFLKLIWYWFKYIVDPIWMLIILYFLSKSMCYQTEPFNSYTLFYFYLSLSWRRINIIIIINYPHTSPPSQPLPIPFPSPILSLLLCFIPYFPKPAIFQNKPTINWKIIWYMEWGGDRRNSRRMRRWRRIKIRGKGWLLMELYFYIKGEEKKEHGLISKGGKMDTKW